MIGIIASSLTVQKLLQEMIIFQIAVVGALHLTSGDFRITTFSADLQQIILVHCAVHKARSKTWLFSYPSEWCILKTWLPSSILTCSSWDQATVPCAELEQIILMPKARSKTWLTTCYPLACTSIDAGLCGIAYLVCLPFCQ